ATQQLRADAPAPVRRQDRQHAQDAAGNIEAGSSRVGSEAGEGPTGEDALVDGDVQPGWIEIGFAEYEVFQQRRVPQCGGAATIDNLVPGPQQPRRVGVAESAKVGHDRLISSFPTRPGPGAVQGGVRGGWAVN